MPISRPIARAAIAVLIVAGGRGLRSGGDVPKQFRRIAGKAVLARSMAPFLNEAGIARIMVVIGDGDAPHYRAMLGDERHERLDEPVVGGASRQASVRQGLLALAEAGHDGVVLVHDGARPFVGSDLIARAMAALGDDAAATPALAVTDTIKRIDGGGHVVETPPRDRLVSVQTPQVFHFAALLAAHDKAAAAGLHDFTDDAALMEWAGHRVATFPGEHGNVKITHPEDFAEAERRLGGSLTTRVGTGYDVHAFGPGDKVWLGGISIPHDHGVIAHSDGDVGLHALTDALLGCLAEGDIGSHFPPSDPQWRGASSDRFLAFAAERVEARGGRIDHLDLTIVCEAPKVGPHRAAIRQRIAAIAGIAETRVAIKATTSERMGFTGRGEGLAALATATVRLPETE